ncbi:MAG: hypothetical protein IKC32_03810 [Clostridia bacterium]|nr:hypothetical protein [Clostridia bacterium]
MSYIVENKTDRDIGSISRDGLSEATRARLENIERRRKFEETQKEIEYFDQGFMVRRTHTMELGLVGAELLVYALLDSFNRETDKPYYGSLGNIASMTGLSDRSVSRAVSDLMNKNLIIRGCEEHYGRMVSTYSTNGAEAVALINERKRRGLVKGPKNHRPR